MVGSKGGESFHREVELRLFFVSLRLSLCVREVDYLAHRRYVFASFPARQVLFRQTHSENRTSGLFAARQDERRAVSHFEDFEICSG